MSHDIDKTNVDLDEQDVAEIARELELTPAAVRDALRSNDPLPGATGDEIEFTLSVPLDEFPVETARDIVSTSLGSRVRARRAKGAIRLRSECREAIVDVRSKGGERVLVSARQRHRGLAGGLFGGIVGGAGGGLGGGLACPVSIAYGAVVTVAWVVGMVAATFGVALVAFRMSKRRRRAQLAEAMAEIRRTCGP
jgi:hypothetical protein